MGFVDNPDAPFGVGLNLKAKLGNHLFTVHVSRQSKTRYAAGGDISWRAYHGHRFEFNVATPVSTRCAISRPASALERWVARSNRWFKTSEVTQVGGACNGMAIWASEPEWASSFLNSTRAQESLAKLFPKDDLAPNIGLKWWPGFVTYSMRVDFTKIDADGMRSRMDALLDLVRAAECFPPRGIVQPNRWERFATAHPVPAGCLVIGLIFGLVIGISVLFSAFLVGITSLLS